MNTPTPTDTPGLIIAGIIGAGAAIIAQIIASIVTSRRDKQRFDWERDRQNYDWKMHERERFLDLKRDLYSNLSFEISKLMAYTHARNYPDLRENLAPVSLEDIRKLQWNIDLLAPEALAKSVSGSVIGQVHAYETAGLEHVGHDRKVEIADEAEREWWKTYDLMRKDLLVSKPQPVTVTLPTPGLPPPRPAGAVTSWPKFQAWRQYRKMLRAYRKTMSHYWWQRSE
jgi:hypothetical protein